MERRRKNRTGKKYLDYRLPFAITTISKCDCRLSHSKGERGHMGGEGKDPFSTSCLDGKKMTNARLKMMQRRLNYFSFQTRHCFLALSNGYGLHKDHASISLKITFKATPLLKLLRRTQPA